MVLKIIPDQEKRTHQIVVSRVDGKKEPAGYIPLYTKDLTSKQIADILKGKLHQIESLV